MEEILKLQKIEATEESLDKKKSISTLVAFLSTISQHC
ncbi:Uncharacterised protein [Streptococcus pneumoniae]|nr:MULTISPECIES: class III lanthipeptide [Bacilli]CIT31289.1 Uncharacterised protein [Streptococcus pneumoniae]